MGLGDLGRLRFAYSPLAEAAESLYMLAGGRIPPVHRKWFESVRGSLDRADLRTLLAAVPAGTTMADFLFGGVVDVNTSIDDQLHVLARTPPDEFRAGILAAWGHREPPPVVDSLSPGMLADALHDYWTIALAPHWPTMRSVLEEDVAFRAAELTKGGVQALLADLHPEVSFQGATMRIDKRSVDEQLALDDGVLMVPGIFVWPNVVFATGRPASLTYAARGVGNLWRDNAPRQDGDTLAGLLGRSRASVLIAVGLPRSTTELALLLAQSPASVSQHLSILKRSGLVVSWRSGRSVLYRRTNLADSLLSATDAFGQDEIVADR